jgi:hypothetical protein
VVANPYEEGLRYAGKRKGTSSTAPTTSAQPRDRASERDERARRSTSTSTADLTLEISPSPPRSMTELQFTVRGAPPDAAVSLSLSMPGMYMGESRVSLTEAGGVYRGTGVLVRCPSGSRRWAADVEVRPRAGPPATRRFELEVVDR